MKSRVITLFIVFALLVLGSCFFYKYLFDNGFGVFNLLVNGTSEELMSTRSGELLAGDKVFGRFQSKYPNLGIVSVRFSNQNRDSDDILMFRFKENGASGWYYEAKYKTDQFLPGKLFPFGFPIIRDSVGKSFQFELESLRGATGSGIFLENTRPVFTAASFFDKNEIFKSGSMTIEFFIKKIVNVVGSPENLLGATVYFSPLIFYLLYLYLAGTSFQFITLIALSSILAEVFYFQFSGYFPLFSILFLWSLVIYRHKFESRISASFALGFLAITPLLLVIGEEGFAEKTAMWVYMFLCITVIQQIYELMYEPKAILTINHFIKTFSKLKIDETKKSSILTKRTLVIFSLLLIVKSLYDTVLGLHYSYLLFLTFNSNTPLPPDLIRYCSLVGAIVMAGCFIFYYKRKILLANVFYLLTFTFLFQQAINFTSSQLTTFQYSPKIFSITPQTTAEAWVDITLKGKNFQDRPFVGKVFIDDIEQGEYVLKWTNEKIVVRTNPTITKSGQMCVKTFSKGDSNCLPFDYRFGEQNTLK